MFRVEAANVNFIIFVLTLPGYGKNMLIETPVKKGQKKIFVNKYKFYFYLELPNSDRLQQDEDCQTLHMYNLKG